MAPFRGFYFLSTPEREAMQEYIDSSLVAGIIHPSSSPAWLIFRVQDFWQVKLIPFLNLLNCLSWELEVSLLVPGHNKYTYLITMNFYNNPLWINTEMALSGEWKETWRRVVKVYDRCAVTLIINNANIMYSPQQQKTYFLATWGHQKQVKHSIDFVKFLKVT